ncbi:MAG: BMP family ABC transporter substrate-binding protein, partial [Oscillospiraceae bacterium]|nr:BMP family ABC transporter substrate-binding protein [Oscillospiraceae bacterium]MBQ6803004.1 BMP family ABC transporter substrate-binding protein [Oscillospiraceae bacterium]
MKKILALLLALVMMLSLAACGTEPEEPVDEPDAPVEGGDEVEEPAEADVAVAMITDYGDITDQSFNQTTYEACKEFCEAEGLAFEYFKPAT